MTRLLTIVGVAALLLGASLLVAGLDPSLAHDLSAVLCDAGLVFACVGAALVRLVPREESLS